MDFSFPAEISNYCYTSFLPRIGHVWTNLTSPLCWHNSHIYKWHQDHSHFTSTCSSIIIVVSIKGKTKCPPELILPTMVRTHSRCMWKCQCTLLKSKYSWWNFRYFRDIFKKSSFSKSYKPHKTSKHLYPLPSFFLLSFFFSAYLPSTVIYGASLPAWHCVGCYR